uniref:Uncharacterized protein n=1 Tax=Fagus sylvatica TaxID=28930 RepID=A0A2N9J012_FAGSY
MASEGSSWHEVRSEELPEGLSDREDEGRSTDEAPSVSGSSKGGEPEKLWIARSYLSKVKDEDGLKKYRDRYQIPSDVVLRIPDLDERACSSRYDDVAFYEADFNVGLSNGSDDLTLDELLFCYKPCQIAVSPRFWTLSARQRGLKLVVGNPSSNREWKDDYVFVCGDNWEALRRPKLSPDGHNRVLRALHHREHHFKHFIRPELLALYSFGPEPSEAVLSLQEINQKTQQGEAEEDDEPAGRGSYNAGEEAEDELVFQESVEVVEFPTAPSSSRLVEKVPMLPRDAFLASRRAKSVVTKDDVREYDKVNTDVVKVAGVHSLMKGLTELTMIANRCIQWEDALDRVVGEMSSLKVDMAAKDEELTKALADRRSADERLKVLTSQMEAIKASAVEDFKSSEAYDDNNTKYFLDGFGLLKKQAKEKYSNLDFEIFQPFDDDESTMPVDGGDGGTTSADPQLDDDAAS